MVESWGGYKNLTLPYFKETASLKKVLAYLERLRLSGIINMYGAAPILNWAKDDLQRWLYGQRLDPESLEKQSDDFNDYDNEQLEHINYLLDNKQEIRDILIRIAMSKIEFEGDDDGYDKVQRYFEQAAIDVWQIYARLRSI